MKSDTDLIKCDLSLNSNVIVLVSPVLVTIMCLQAPLQSFTATNRRLTVQWGDKEVSDLNILEGVIKHVYAATITNKICQLHIFYEVCFQENGAATELLTWAIKLFPL